MPYFSITWLKVMRIGPSKRSPKEEIPLAVQHLKAVSKVPGRKSGLPVIGVKTDVSPDLPSICCVILNALIVLIVTGLLQFFFKHFSLSIRSRFFRGQLDRDFSISSKIEEALFLIQSATYLTWALNWYLLISRRSSPPIALGNCNSDILIHGLCLHQIKVRHQLFRFFSLFYYWIRWETFVLDKANMEGYSFSEGRFSSALIWDYNFFNHKYNIFLNLSKSLCNFTKL